MEKRSINALQRFMAVLLCLAMLLPMIAVPGYATEGTDGDGSAVTGSSSQTTDPEDTGSGEAGSGEAGSGEAGSDETGSDETGSDETGSDETGSDETGSDKVGSDEIVSDEIVSDEIVTDGIQSEDTELEGTEEEEEQIMLMTTGTPPKAVIYAASDIQWYKTVNGAEQDNRAKGETVMKNIIASIKAFGYENGTSFAVTHGIFLGDYSKSSRPYKTPNQAENDAGLKSVATVLGDNANGFGLTSNLNEITTLTDTSNAGDQVIYIQGNHDPITTNGLDASFGHDMGEFHVFVMHEEDFPWKQGVGLSASGNKTAHATAVNNTAAELQKFLEERISTRDNRPIFIAAHIPLHYTYRTTDGDGDNL